MKTLVCVRLAAYISMAIILTSCSFGGRFAYDAIDYNKAVEKAANAQILLNALRARDRKPMHFSTISQLRGGHTISSTGGLSFSIPFGALGDAASAYTVSPSVSLTRSTSPSFDVAVSDTQEFHQGILQPVKMDTLEFYWQQRWPPALLLHLFIHRVEKIEECKKAQEDENLNKKKKIADAARTKDDATKTPEEKEAERYVKQYAKREAEKKAKGCEKTNEYENAPEYDSFVCFSAWVEEMMDEGLVVRRKEEGTGIGPILERWEVSDLKRLVGVQTAKLSLIKLDNSKYRLCEIERSADFCLGKCEGPTVKEQCEKEEPTTAAIPGTRILVNPKLPGKDYKIETKYKIHLRSVQGILYHLGELVRAWDAKEPKKQRQVHVEYGHGPRSDWKDVPLFRLEPVASFSAGDSPLAVEYEGKVYMVPPDDKESGLTETAMSLVAQLLGLNKTGKELPKTTAVEVVGR